jgi:hypothetical protein
MSPKNFGSEHLKSLWTKDKNLNFLLRQSFEAMWITSKDLNTMRNIKTEDYIKIHLNSLRPKEHSTLIYRSILSRNEVLCNFCKIGLENGEAVIYIGSKDEHLNVKEVLKNSGIDVTKYEMANALRLLPDTEFYIVEGEFNRLRTCNLIKQIYDSALEEGFSGCRIFGDMSCFFKHNLTKELIKYEKSLHKFLDVPIIAICAYDGNILCKCDGKEGGIADILRTHCKIFTIDSYGRLDTITNS